MPKKIREVIRMIEDDGWYLVSHQHPVKPERVTMPVNRAMIWRPARTIAFRKTILTKNVRDAKTAN